MGLLDWTINRMAGAAADNSIITLQAKTTAGLTSEIKKFSRKGYIMQGGISTNFEYGRPVYYATMIRAAVSSQEQPNEKEYSDKSEQEKLDQALEEKRKELRALEEKQNKLKELEELDRQIQTKKNTTAKQPAVDAKEESGSSIKQSISQGIKQTLSNDLGLEKQKANLKKSLQKFVDKL